MKTDRFMQGILISDEDELFSYPHRQAEYSLHHLVSRMKKMKNNMLTRKYFAQHEKLQQANKQAVFSKNTIEGSVDEAISDVWHRLRVDQSTTKRKR